MLEPGHIFASRYRVRRCIAEGGMGAIFEAEHLATERRVALKLLLPHVLNLGNVREKFELEAKISARVNSPHIVQVFDAGIDAESGSPFLVMELLEGETLARRVARQGRLPLAEALPFLGQVAAGLDAAHGYCEPGGSPKPIVHRDLKPENLFLATLPDGSVTAKILDFGIAKVLDDRAEVSQEVRGTPQFMAVEQITASPLSPQTDIWAYGLIAHYVLTGVDYWRTACGDGVSVQALFAEIVMLPLDRPSVRWRERSLDVPLPGDFDEWFLRCIDREPPRRFEGAGAAFQALEATLAATGHLTRNAAGARTTVKSSASPAAGREAAPPSVSAADIGRMTAVTPEKAAGAGSVPAMMTTTLARPPLPGARERRPRGRRLVLLAGLVGASVAATLAWLRGPAVPERPVPPLALSEGGAATSASADEQPRTDRASGEVAEVAALVPAAPSEQRPGEAAAPTPASELEPDDVTGSPALAEPRATPALTTSPQDEPAAPLPESSPSGRAKRRATARTKSPATSPSRDRRGRATVTSDAYRIR